MGLQSAEECFKITKDTLKRRENLPLGEIGFETDIHNVSNVIPFYKICLIYITYVFLLIFGIIREYAEKLRIKLGYEASLFEAEKGYAPLFKELQYFWLKHCFQRMRDCFERPICSVPGGDFKVMDRISTDFNATFQMLGTSSHCLNLGSYNYLGFGENNGPVIDQVWDSIDQHSFATSSAVCEAGQNSVLRELEEAVCRFVGKPSAMIFGMGFATNSTTIPGFAGKGTLVISDQLNHSSLVTGMRDSGAKIHVFKHNDMEDLEMLLRASIVEGQPRSRRPWKKIILFVEGIYSMEGQICNLPEIVRLKKKYKCYLYVDEAHSIGCLGTRGRGVCEHWGINPADVDILMGTFTKAFGSVGGYIAADSKIIDYLKMRTYGNYYAESMSPPCAMQALAALKMISGEDGTQEGAKRLARIKDNANFFRTSLQKRP